MSSLINATPVTTENLLHQVALLKQQGCRLITLTCLDTGDGHEVIYHFAQKYEMIHLRKHVANGGTLISISTIFFCAMIVENEIKDHFGIEVHGLPIDFQGRLVLSENAPRAPMNKRCGMEIDARVPEPASTVVIAPASPPAKEAVPQTPAKGGVA
jgi:ech hydrogenase subunit D